MSRESLSAAKVHAYRSPRCRSSTRHRISIPPGSIMYSRIAAPTVCAILLAAVLSSTQHVGAQDSLTPVAVLRYDNNTTDTKYDNLGRALSTMMVSDLSVLEELQLVERDRLEDLLNELELQQSVYADPATAQTVGVMVGAEYVVTGAFVTVDPDIRLDTRIVRVETSEVVKTAEVAGPSNELLTLQQRMADEFIDGLEMKLTEEQRARLRERQRANSLGTLDTALQFSTVLCLIDGGAYVEALEEISAVREKASGSQIVQSTFSLLQERVEEEARDEVKDRANSMIGGLMGRDPAPEPIRRESPTGC